MIPAEKSSIEQFLRAEDLSYQKIDLPYGLATPGHERRQLKELLLEDVQGRSVLDVGSFLGAMCVTALQNGASRAVGIELNSDRLRQAKAIAGFLQVAPEFLGEDIEEMALDEDFDIVLLLNVLHHLRDPIGVLRRLTRRVQHRLIVESASLGVRDSLKLGLGPLSRRLFSRHPTAFVGPCHPAELSQTYFFSRDGLMRILDGHIKAYWRIDCHRSEFKNRFILDCRKLSVERMVLVAGCVGRETSAFCDALQRNQFRDHLGSLSADDVVRSTPGAVWERPLHQIFPSQSVDQCIFEYDLSLVKRFKLHSFRRDPATGVVESAKNLDAVLLLRTLDELRGVGADSPEYGLYEEPSRLLNLYSDWLDYLTTLSSNLSIHLVTGSSGVPHLQRCQSVDEARERVKSLYSSGTGA